MQINSDTCETSEPIETREPSETSESSKPRKSEKKTSENCECGGKQITYFHVFSLLQLGET